MSRKPTKSSADAGASRRAILDRLKLEGPQTAAQLAEILGMTPMGARQHLAILAENGLVVHEDRRGHVGRPSRTWALSAAGHAQFTDRHADLTVELLDAMQDSLGEAGLDRLLESRLRLQTERYRSRLPGTATPLAERVAALARLREDEGYMARWWEEAPGRFFLVENHCPVCEAAKACRGLCASEWTLFQDVLGPDAKVERTEHILNGSRRCVYSIDQA